MLAASASSAVSVRPENVTLPSPDSSALTRTNSVPSGNTILRLPSMSTPA